MFKFKPQDWILTVGIIAGLFAVFFLSGALENRQKHYIENLGDEELSLQGGKLKGYAFGFEGLLADWYWIRSLQYIGDKIYNSKTEIDIDNLTPLDPKLLYPLLDNATTLDPQFLAVYSYGSNVMPAIDKKQAVEIAKKGIENNPDEWLLYHQLGFIYWRIKEFEKARETYENGSKIPGAPEWMKSMAARVSTEGGSRETAREIYKQLFDNASDSQTKESAKLRLLELDSFEEREILDETLLEFRQQNGRCAVNWSEIRNLLLDKKLPRNRDFRQDKAKNIVDPTDAPYVIDRVLCKTTLSFEKTKLPKQ